MLYSNYSAMIHLSTSWQETFTDLFFLILIIMGIAVLGWFINAEGKYLMRQSNSKAVKKNVV